MLKRFVRSFFRSRGFDLVKGPNIRTFLDVHDVDLVVDVGANEGQFARNLRQHGYDRRIMSFEPVSAVFAILSSYAQKDAYWDVLKTAVGERPDSVSINVSEYSVFSSIKPVTSEALEFDSTSQVVRQETVPVDTLDNLLQADRAKRLFVKIDTQGFEPEVLAGATRTLERTMGVQLELPISRFYDNSWSLMEALTVMRDNGFVPAQFRMVNPMRQDPASGTEFDCIFRRA